MVCTDWIMDEKESCGCDTGDSKVKRVTPSKELRKFYAGAAKDYKIPFSVNQDLLLFMDSLRCYNLLTENFQICT